MSEYIVKLSDAIDMPNMVGGERITRCRDCRNRAGENEQGVDPYFCIYHRMHAQPNFFCAWGERKEGGDA